MKNILLWILQVPLIIIRTIGFLVVFIILWLLWLVGLAKMPVRTLKDREDHAMKFAWKNYDILGVETTVTYAWPTVWHFVLYGFHSFYRKETMS